jgi:hypothetical protein
MTLTYKISNLDTHPTRGQFDKIELDLSDFIGINGDFEFYIESRLTLKQECWNVGELTQQLLELKKSGLQDDFHYNCIDAEEKHLFTFKKVTGGFQFFSEWAVQNIESLIDRNTIEEFIESYAKTVKQEIKGELDFDVSPFYL